MKKLFLTALLVALAACLFALGVSAAGASTDEFGTAEALEGIPVDLTDTTSRVVLKGSDGLFRTFPSSYIYFKTGSGNWNWRGEAKCTFEYINAALGLTEENAYTMDSIIRIEVPNDLRYLEGFNGKANLKEMYFSPNSEMTNMRPMGSGCGVEKITMPPKQTSYASYLFHTCPNLTTVIFYENENLKSLPTEMFKACTSLEEFTFPSSVTSFGGSFFSGCTALRRVTLSPGITSIGTTFSYLANLEYVNTENITSFSNKAFQSCSKLNGIVINEAVTSIPNDFCKGCSSLTSITIPSKVTEIRGYAFDGCSSLTSVTNNSTVLKEIHGNAFSGCPMTEFKNTGALVSIGQYAFSGAKFTSIDLPNTITSLGQGCFEGCTNLTYVRVPELVTQIPHDFLKSTSGSKITLVVPKGCTSIYSQYSLQNSGVQTIIFTGDENSEFVASVTEKASGWVSKITYGNHCEYYYDKVHIESDNPCVSYCSRCGETVVKENPAHVIVTTITYVSFDVDGEKVIDCTNEGCPYHEEKVAPALFTVFGDSMCIFDEGVTTCYQVNQAALKDYKDTMGVTLEYGVFAIKYENIGEAGILESNGLLSYETSKQSFDMFEIKLTGFVSDREKTAKISMGAYIVEKIGEEKSVSYIQTAEPNEGEEYSYFVYNNLINVQ